MLYIRAHLPIHSLQTNRGEKHLDIYCVTSQLKVFPKLSHTLCSPQWGHSSEHTLQTGCYWKQLVWIGTFLAGFELKTPHQNHSTLDIADWLPAPSQFTSAAALPAAGKWQQPLLFLCFAFSPSRALLAPPTAHLTDCTLPSLLQ